MTKYRLVGFKTSTWTQRAAIVLREKKVEFEFVQIESGNRPDWFAALSPHGKVPVLKIGDTIALFESNAIAEYLDETIQPRLLPEDPVDRAINRAWTDYLPTFASAFSALLVAKTEESLTLARETLAKSFALIDEALNKRGNGPYFNGANYALVDAGYAPFLQRYLIVEKLTDDEVLSRKFPAVEKWAQALTARATTHTFSPDAFRALYIDSLGRRGGLIGQRALGA